MSAAVPVTGAPGRTVPAIDCDRDLTGVGADAHLAAKPIIWQPLLPLELHMPTMLDIDFLKSIVCLALWPGMPGCWVHGGSSLRSLFSDLAVVFSVICVTTKARQVGRACLICHYIWPSCG